MRKANPMSLLKFIYTKPLLIFVIGMRKIKGQSIYSDLNNERWVRQKYEVEELTTYEIADTVGCCQWAVVSALHRFSIAPRKRFVYKELQDEEWLHQKYDIEELSAEKIAQIVGCGAATVWDALKRANITRRPCSVKGEKNPCYGTHPSQVTKEKMRKAKEGVYDGDKNPFYGKKHTKETIETIKEKSKGKHYSPATEWKKGTLPWNTGKTNVFSEETLERIRKSAKALWRDEEHVRKWFKANQKHPNSIEYLMDEILQRNRPNEWKYNGNFEAGVTIGGMIPDFVNVNGQKAVIEVFGDFWHDETKRDINWKYTEFCRKAAYSQLGYICVVIWEKDLKRSDAEQFILSVLKKEGVI